MNAPLRRAIIIDDNPSTSLVLEFMLEELGFDVCSLHQPETLLEHLNSHSYDVMLLDWMMPHLDGITLLPLLRARTDLAHMKIIMCTARSSANDKTTALQNGADLFLNKPFKIDTLRICLQEVGVLAAAA